MPLETSVAAVVTHEPAILAAEPVEVLTNGEDAAPAPTATPAARGEAGPAPDTAPAAPIPTPPVEEVAEAEELRRAAS